VSEEKVNSTPERRGGEDKEEQHSCPCRKETVKKKGAVPSPDDDSQRNDLAR